MDSMILINRILLSTTTRTLPLCGSQLSLVHEMIHFNSFQQYIMRPDNDGRLMPRPQVIGLDVIIFHDDQHVSALFRDLHEAIVTELTKRFDHKYFETIDYTKVDTENRDIVKAKVAAENSRDQNWDVEDASVYLVRRQPNGKVNEGLERYNYVRERKKLWNLVDQILDQNRSTFKDKEEVFSLFAKAVMAGATTPLIEIIETTFGPGSWEAIGQTTAYRTRKNLQISE